MTITTDDNRTFLLQHINCSWFSICQEKPYPFRYEWDGGNSYVYRSILIDGKFYGIKEELNFGTPGEPIQPELVELFRNPEGHHETGREEDL